jgi:hypothetical protein
MSAGDTIRCVIPTFMAEEIASPDGAASPAPAADVAPTVEPSASVETPPVVAEAVVASPAAAAEAVTETPAETASLVEGADAAKAEAPAEAIAEPPKAEEPKAEAAPPEPIVYGDFKLPEGMTVPDERMSQFKLLAGGLNIPQDEAQKFLDLHADIVKQTQEAMDQRQRDIFDETRAGWRKEIEKRWPNNHQTVVNNAKWAVEQLYPNAAERKGIWNMLGYTGAGDNPDMIDFMARTAKRLQERTAPPQGIPARNQPTNPADRRYGAPRS